MNKSLADGSHMIDILFTLALFCVFAASSLMVVLIGANVYQSTVESQEQNFVTCTSVSYVTSKIRQHDASGAVYMDTLDGVDALVLEQYELGRTFQTWIYHHDGALRELMTESGNAGSVHPDAGQSIVEVEEFSISAVNANLLRLSARNDAGKSVEIMVSLRT